MSTQAARSRSMPPLRRSQRRFTRHRISPGKAYNAYIKGRYDMLGYVDAPMSEAHLQLMVTHPNVSHAETKADSWIVATTYATAHGNVPSVLIIWTNKGRGMAYTKVPSFEVGRLHGFATIEEVREMTSEELVETLKRSLKS